MSWTANCQIEKGTTLSQANNLLKECELTGNDNCPGERQIAFDAARDAVVTCIGEGVLGNLSECGFQVNITGHCNPGNKPCADYANDFLSIQIQQVAPRPAPTPEREAEDNAFSAAMDAQAEARDEDRTRSRVW